MRVPKIVLSIYIFLIVVSCSKKSDTSPTAPVNASISGQVALYNDGSTLLANSGMTVSLDNTFPLYSSVTNGNGMYSIPQVPFGNSTLVFEKAGYGTYKIFNINHAYNNGAGTVLSTLASLGKISTTAVTGLTAIVSSGNVTVGITSIPGGTDASPRYLRLFLSFRTGVSHTNYQTAFDLIISKTNTVEKILTKAELNTLGFASGSTVYVRAYGDSFWSNSYEDPLAVRTIFPNLNLSTVAAASFIVP